MAATLPTYKEIPVMCPEICSNWASLPDYVSGRYTLPNTSPAATAATTIPGFGEMDDLQQEAAVAAHLQLPSKLICRKECEPKQIGFFHEMEVL